MRVVPLIVLLLMACGSSVNAQDVHPYVGGAVEMSTFGVNSLSGSPSMTFGNTSTDSTIFGVRGEAGLFLGRRIAVGAEFDMPLERASVTSSHGYFNPYTRESQFHE